VLSQRSNFFEKDSDTAGKTGVKDGKKKREATPKNMKMERWTTTGNYNNQ
jgi:hypothetical protein